MPSAPRTPQDHYAEALRLLNVAGNAATDPSPELQRLRSEALAEAGVHAMLALAPRRARRDTRHPADSAPTHSPQHRWLFPDGDDQ